MIRLSQTSPFISLSDLYCYWNRARGSSLLSPQEVVKAAATLPQIRSSYQVTKMPGGSLVITDATFEERIQLSIRKAISSELPWKGITSLGLANLQGLSTILAKEQLSVSFNY